MFPFFLRLVLRYEVAPLCLATNCKPLSGEYDWNRRMVISMRRKHYGRYVAPSVALTFLGGSSRRLPRMCALARRCAVQGRQPNWSHVIRPCVTLLEAHPYRSPESVFFVVFFRLRSEVYRQKVMGTHQALGYVSCSSCRCRSAQR